MLGNSTLMAKKSRRKSSLWRQVRIVAVLVLIAGGVLYGLIWLQDAPLRNARYLLESGNAADALKILDSWREDSSRREGADALRARCLVKLERHREALAIFHRVGAETTSEIHDWAKACLHLQQWAEALPLLQTVRERSPDDPDVHHELAACYGKLGRVEEALDCAKELATYEDYKHRAWLLMGMLLRDKENKAEAAQIWSRIAESESSLNDLQVPSDEFLTQFASLQLELGNPAAAVEALQRALKIRNTPEAHFQLGLAEEQLRHAAEAEAHWRVTLELDPGHQKAAESLARACLATGLGTEAEELLKPFLQHNHVKSTTTYLMERAAVLQDDLAKAETWRGKTEQLRKIEQIQSAMTQVLRENPDSYWAQVVRCYQFAESGNWAEAESAVNQLPNVQTEDAFVVELRRAVKQRNNLPSIELLPLRLF